MKIYCNAGNIINSLGHDTDLHWNNTLDLKTTLQSKTLNNGFETQASYLNEDQWNELRKTYGDHLTKCALLCIESINKCREKFEFDLNDTIIIVATTKGDVDLMTEDLNDNSEFYLSNIANQLDIYFQTGQKTITLSNACISGAQAIQTGAALIKSGKVKNAIACGVDLMTEFTLSGFNSLKALSNDVCKPFDAERNGISLGEAAATIVLSTTPTLFNELAEITFDGGFVSNDANHISGPSRTGEGLYQSLKAVSDDFKNKPDAISLHGTATLFNDDMESIALERAGYQDIETFGLKGIYGHTLGAAGVLESVLSIYALCHNLVPGTTNFSTSGTAATINVSTTNILKEIKTIYKCTSGFGGGNCVLSFSKSTENG